MSHPCLIIFSTTESPAWELPLAGGQAYIGRDDCDAGALRLIVSLDGASALTPAQEDFLIAHPDVLKFDVFADCSARSMRLIDSTIPGTGDLFQSHRDGIYALPHTGDEPIWRRQRK
jgi:hypothetical protein